MWWQIILVIIILVVLILVFITNISIYRNIGRLTSIPSMYSTDYFPEYQQQPEYSSPTAQANPYVLYRNLNHKPQSVYPSQSGLNNYAFAKNPPLPIKLVDNNNKPTPSTYPSQANQNNYNIRPPDRLPIRKTRIHAQEPTPTQQPIPARPKNLIRRFLYD